MPRLRHIGSGAVVSCSDETAAALPPGDWLPIELEVAPAPVVDVVDEPAPAPRKRAPRKPRTTAKG